MTPFWYGVALVAIMSGVTILLRSLPFLIFRPGKPVPKIVTDLADMLPSAVMAMLLVYCLKGISFTAAPFGAPELISTAAVVGLHLWLKNSLVSVFGGTVLYMVLVQAVF